MLKKKFWVIFNESGNNDYDSKPAYKLVRHNHRNQAEKELNRLAAEHPGETFILLEAQKSCTSCATVETVLE